MNSKHRLIASLLAMVVSVQAGGSISGSVKGKPKSDEQKIVKKNAEQCGAHIAAEKYIIGANGGVQWAVAMLVDVKGGKPMTVPSDLVFENVECKFKPHVLLAPMGATLKVKKSDDMLHNSHFVLMEGINKKNLINMALPKKDQVIENNKILRKEGLIAVQCDAHEFMQGYIWSLPNAYGAVTGVDGSFTMADVPPGSYTLKIWHEALGEKTVKVTVEEGKETKVVIDL